MGPFYCACAKSYICDSSIKKGLGRNWRKKPSHKYVNMKKVWQKLTKSAKFARKEKKSEDSCGIPGEQTNAVLTLQDMPDEIILKIINYLKIKDLGRCAKVSKRLKTIWYDSSSEKNIEIMDTVQPLYIDRLNNDTLEITTILLLTEFFTS